jgi:uncharacterized metal-binding protein
MVLLGNLKVNRVSASTERKYSEVEVLVRIVSLKKNLLVWKKSGVICLKKEEEKPVI